MLEPVRSALLFAPLVPIPEHARSAVLAPTSGNGTTPTARAKPLEDVQVLEDQISSVASSQASLKPGEPGATPSHQSRSTRDAEDG